MSKMVVETSSPSTHTDDALKKEWLVNKYQGQWRKFHVFILRTIPGISTIWMTWRISKVELVYVDTSDLEWGVMWMKQVYLLDTDIYICIVVLYLNDGNLWYYFLMVPVQQRAILYIYVHQSMTVIMKHLIGDIIWKLALSLVQHLLIVINNVTQHILTIGLVTLW